MRTAARTALCGLLVFSPGASAQEKPLERAFTPGVMSSYRIQLTVRSEISGQQTEKIGAKTYVRPFSRVAERGLSWTATRRILSVASDGSAEAEETLDDFAAAGDGGGPASEEEEAGRLSQVLRGTLERWVQKRILRYRETRAGQLLDLKLEGAPALDEAPPPLLMLWLLRALRPTAALPDKPIRFHERWQEPRAAPLRNWTDVRGSETGEWLEALEVFEPAAQLHTVQQIFGTVVAGSEKPPEGAAQARFHGESLNTISLTDGWVLAATRSATREVTWTLAPAEGLQERPEFRAKLSVEVRIEGCHETSCLSRSAPALPRQ